MKQCFCNDPSCPDHNNHYFDGENFIEIDDLKKVYRSEDPYIEEIVDKRDFRI